MLLANFNLLFDDPGAFFVLVGAVAVSLLIAISVHEWAHAASAALQGDFTARRQGRLTLNPGAHLEPVGTVMLLVAGFGWGRPVPFDPRALRTGRLGVALVSFAGPLSNIVLALLFALLFRVGLLDAGEITRGALHAGNVSAWLSLIGIYSVTLNLILAAFNLLPLAPLDGSGILTGLAPRRWLPLVRRVNVWGPVALVMLILSNLAFDVNVLGFVFDPVIRFADRLVGA